MKQIVYQAQCQPTMSFTSAHQQVHLTLALSQPSPPSSNHKHTEPGSDLHTPTGSGLYSSDNTEEVMSSERSMMFNLNNESVLPDIPKAQSVTDKLTSKNFQFVALASEWSCQTLKKPLKLHLLQFL